MSAALALIGFSSSPVFAGHWGSLDITYSGSTVNVSGSQTETLNWKDEGGPRNGSASAYPGSSGSTTINGTITTKWTWIPDPNIPNDAAPPEIWVDENATADWNADGSSLSTTKGTHSLSIGGTVTINTDDDLNTSVTPYSKSGKLGKHDVHKIPVAGGVAEVACRFQTECHGGDGPTEPQSTKRNTSMYTSVSYRVEIIATPYDFKLAPGYPWSDWIAGRLHFNYTWKSTSGNLADLWHPGTSPLKVLIYEHTTYPTVSSDGFYHPPIPPFDFVFYNPTDFRIISEQDPTIQNVGARAQGDGGQLPEDDTHGHGNLLSGVGEFTATQDWRWYCPAIHGRIEDGNYEILKGIYGEAHPIKRKVEGLGYGYHFTVEKHGAVASFDY